MKSTGSWTEEENALFELGLERYGKEWRFYAQLIKTRAISEIRTHAQKHFAKLARRQRQHQTQPQTTVATTPPVLLTEPAISPVTEPAVRVMPTRMKAKTERHQTIPLTPPFRTSNKPAQITAQNVTVSTRYSKANVALFDSQLKNLQEYKAKHGHTRVSRGTSDKPFSDWVSKQRTFRKRGQLAQCRIDALDKLGFTWTLKHDLDSESPVSSQSPKKRIKRQHEPDTIVVDLFCNKSIFAGWDDQYARLETYFKTFGHTHLPCDEWIQEQRCAFRCGSLSREQIIKLKSIKFVFAIPEQETEEWERQCFHLACFCVVHGHCRVPLNWPENKLGLWVAHQRLLESDFSICTSRAQKLDGLGFLWNGRYMNYRWQMMLDDLEAHAAMRGTLTCNFQQNQYLADWVCSQKYLKRRGLLLKDREEKLVQAGLLFEDLLPTKKLVYPVDTSVKMFLATFGWQEGKIDVSLAVTTCNTNNDVRLLRF
jgi:hypothetical protein